MDSSILTRLTSTYWPGMTKITMGLLNAQEEADVV